MELKFILESVLFAAQKPLSPKEIKELLAGATEHSQEEAVLACKRTRLEQIVSVLEELRREHDTAARSYRLVCVAGSWQFVSQPEFAPWIKALVGHKARPPRLSQPALETLAIIAYRQPLTRAEIEQVRGVTVDGVLATLIERGLVEQVGRAELPGRPITYGTTLYFLEYFGLRSLAELPAGDELRRVLVEKPSTLVTAEPGLATVPPEQLTMAEISLAQASQKPTAASDQSGGEAVAPQESNLHGSND
jgi:segregation and condensation protein B